jgi:hypothetical protein
MNAEVEVLSSRSIRSHDDLWKGSAELVKRVLQTDGGRREHINVELTISKRKMAIPIFMIAEVVRVLSELGEQGRRLKDNDISKDDTSKLDGKNGLRRVRRSSGSQKECGENGLADSREREGEVIGGQALRWGSGEERAGRVRKTTRGGRIKRG